jgi:UDPglucose--hexose-1-phosphate uridylyltransferase
MSGELFSDEPVIISADMLPPPSEETDEPIEGGSELRQDIVTGDWVIVATSRAKRPSDFADFHRADHDAGIGSCLFEHPEETGQEPDVLMYRTSDQEWSLRVFPNKYPALTRGRAPRSYEEGPYFSMTGVGYHEVIVTRDHYRHLALMDTWRVAEVLDAYQDRYLTLMKKKSVKYIQIFHNHGKEAGASIAHPHSQLMAVPVISPYIQAELRGAELYRRSNRQQVYTTIAEFESEHGARVVYENDRFIAFCPFAARSAFEVWVMPKFPAPYFERITHEDKFLAAEVLQKALLALYHGLGDPPYNFYLHTAPCDGRDYPFFQWHIEILPHTATWAGFELSTGIEIVSIQPEVAAEHLRNSLNTETSV